jgi:hypothetical protein
VTCSATIRARLAPSAVRTASSRVRKSPHAQQQVATLAQRDAAARTTRRQASDRDGVVLGAISTSANESRGQKDPCASPDAGAPVGLAIGRKLRACLTERHVSLSRPNTSQPRASATSGGLALDHERAATSSCVRETEAWRHHANHGPAVRPMRTTHQRCWDRRRTRLPDVVSEYERQRRRSDARRRRATGARAAVARTRSGNVEGRNEGSPCGARGVDRRPEVHFCPRKRPGPEAALRARPCDKVEAAPGRDRTRRESNDAVSATIGRDSSNGVTVWHRERC